jgi:hypothetical protein
LARGKANIPLPKTVLDIWLRHWYNHQYQYGYVVLADYLLSVLDLADNHKKQNMLEK